MASLTFKKFLILYSAAAALYVGGAGLARSYVASSTNYVLQSDSVNFGGERSTSSAYSLEDTMGEIASGYGASPSQILSAGYQQMDTDSYIAVSGPSSVAMTPTVNGAGGGASTGSSSWTVTTDNPAGYELSVRSLASPAMASAGGSFADYVPGHSDPDYNWTTPETEARFGFSPEGGDIVGAFRDNGVSCNSGTDDAPGKCWTGFSEADRVISRSGTPTGPGGATTTIKFQAEVGSKKSLNQGSYSATIVLTAVSL